MNYNNEYIILIILIIRKNMNIIVNHPAINKTYNIEIFPTTTI